MEGLRTLCLAVRDIPQAEYDAWNEIYQEASRAYTGRSEKLDAAAELVRVRTHTFIHVFVCVKAHTFIYVFVCVKTHTNSYMCLYAYTQIHICVCMCKHTQSYMCLYA